MNRGGAGPRSWCEVETCLWPSQRAVRRPGSQLTVVPGQASCLLLVWWQRLAPSALVSPQQCLGSLLALTRAWLRQCGGWGVLGAQRKSVCAWQSLTSPKETLPTPCTYAISVCVCVCLSPVFFCVCMCVCVQVLDRCVWTPGDSLGCHSSGSMHLCLETTPPSGLVCPCGLHWLPSEP